MLEPSSCCSATGGTLARAGIKILIALAWASATGCANPATVECFGNLCPTGTRCVTALEQCAAIEQIDACEGAGLPDGSACRFADQQGLCQDGVCAAGCGDGLRLDEEVCDGSSFGGATCLDHGFYAGELGCSASCDVIQTDRCVGSCGDGVVNGPELCDVNTFAPRCVLSGWDRGLPECAMACQWPSSGCAVNEFRGIDALISLSRVHDLEAFGPGQALLAADGGLLEVIGARIRPVVTPTSAAIQAVWAPSPEIGFATTSAGEILRRDASGQWIIEPGVSLHADTEASSVTGLGPDRVWAVAGGSAVEPSKLLAYDGTAWTPISLPGSNPDLIKLAAVGSGSGERLWALGRLDDSTDAIHLYENGIWTSFGGHDVTTLEAVRGMDLYAASSADLYVTERDLANPFDPRGAVWHLHHDGTTWSATRLTDPRPRPLAQVWTFDATTATWLDETAAAGSAGGADVPLLAEVGSALYAGSDAPFARITLDLVTAGVGGAGAWEYWDGAAWTSLAPIDDFDDATLGMTAAPASHVVAFTPPVDWTPVAVNGSAPRYFVRFRSAALYTTAAVVQRIELEDRPILSPYAAWLSVDGTGPSHVLVSNTRFGATDFGFDFINELWHFDGARWEQLQAGDDLIELSSAPAVAFALAFRAGDGATLRRFDGSSWLRVSNGEGYLSPNGISGAAQVGPQRYVASSNHRNDGLAPGDPGWVPYLWRFDPATGWEEISFPGGDGGAPMHDAWSPDGEAVFVVGDGIILVRRAGAWTRYDIPGAPRLNAVGGLSATDVYAVGVGTILHFDGSAWTEVHDAGAVELTRLAVASDGTVYAFGSGCTLLVSSQGAWAPFAPAPPCQMDPGASDGFEAALWTPRPGTLHLALTDLGLYVFEGGQWQYDSRYNSLNGTFSGFPPVRRILAFGADDAFGVGAVTSSFNGDMWTLIASVPAGLFGLSPIWRAITGDERTVNLIGEAGEIWTLTRLWPWRCRAVETCGNGVDDDCDGLFDRDDSECPAP